MSVEGVLFNDKVGVVPPQGRRGVLSWEVDIVPDDNRCLPANNDPDRNNPQTVTFVLMRMEAAIPDPPDDTVKTTFTINCPADSASAAAGRGARAGEPVPGRRVAPVRRPCRAGAGWAIGLFWAAQVAATLYVVPPDEALLGRSDLVVYGEVVSSELAPSPDRIETDHVVRVEEVMKGSVPDGRLVVRQYGGLTPDGVLAGIHGVRMLAPGDRVLLFLTPGQAGRLGGGGPRPRHVLRDRFRWTPALRAPNRRGGCDRTAGRSAGGGAAACRAAAGGGGLPRLAEGAGPGSRAGRGVLRSTRARGRRPASSRWRSPSSSTKWGATRTPCRESAGASSTGASRWTSSSTPRVRPAFRGGGFTEVANAMAAWNALSGTGINFASAGRTSNIVSARTDDGKNQILFEDPFGDISGSFDDTGGTAAIITWSFDCGATHFIPDGGTTVSVVWLETDLVTQDGFGPTLANKLTSPGEMFEKVVGHELGHSLGIGALLHVDGGAGQHLPEPSGPVAHARVPGGGRTGCGPEQRRHCGGAGALPGGRDDRAAAAEAGGRKRWRWRRRGAAPRTGTRTRAGTASADAAHGGHRTGRGVRGRPLHRLHGRAGGPPGREHGDGVEAYVGLRGRRNLAGSEPAPCLVLAGVLPTRAHRDRRRRHVDREPGPAGPRQRRGRRLRAGTPPLFACWTPASRPAPSTGAPVGNPSLQPWCARARTNPACSGSSAPATGRS